MIRQLAVSLLAAFLLSAPAYGQSVAAPAPPATILVIAIERVLEESAAARDIRRQIEEIRGALRTEALETDRALKDEEQALVALKQDASEDEFEESVSAFEQRVREARRASQTKGAELQAAIARAQARLRQMLTPILAEIMKDRGATLLLDETQIVLSARELDITDDAIERLDRVAPALPLEYAPGDGG